MVDRLKGKIAIVTGGAAGIGKEIAHTFLEEGAFVWITDIDENAGKKTSGELGKKIAFYKQNVQEEKGWQELMKLVEEKNGKLDILINNAGIMGLKMGPQNPEQMTLNIWHTLHAINLDSVFLGCKQAIQLMKKNTGGSIVNMSSRSGLVGVPNAAAYASTKAAIRNYTKSVALYCAQKNYNIRCNSIHPAAIKTHMWENLLDKDKIEKQKELEKIDESIPLHHMGTPKDVAYLALYLASDESGYMTGSELVLDGGILAGSAVSPEKKPKR